MAGVNKVILVGYLGKDPEMKYGQQSGKAVTRYSLATTERFGGEDRTEWHNIVCFDRLAEISNEYLAKGRLVYLEGRIQNRSWDDKEGTKRYITEIIVFSMQMLGGGSGRKNEDEAYRPASNSEQTQKKDTKEERTVPEDPFSGDFGPPPTDDDVPF